MLKREAAGLDPMPSPAKLREMYERRTGVPVAEFLKSPPPMFANAGIRLEAEPGIVGVREGDALELVLKFPPRTKKNSTTLGIRQSPAYVAYRQKVIQAVASVREALRLPLPPRPMTYNIAATYYVDGWGERADKCGLDQGLYDALENAGVVENDWQFRTDDGTRIVIGDPEPRVEITITPIADE